MTSSMDWGDGAAGGTPLSAANLDKLTVNADLGTIGSRSGEALEDAVAAMLVPGPNMSLTYDDTTGLIHLDAASGGGGGGTLATMAGQTVCFADQNSDGTWPDRPIDRTDVKCFWVRVTTTGANPSQVASPAVNGAYTNDVVLVGA